jgi:hypothetical protein
MLKRGISLNWVILTLRDARNKSSQMWAIELPSLLVC